MKKLFLFMQTVLLLSFLFSLSCADKTKTIYGTWQLNSKKSTDIVTVQYRQLEMKIQKEGEAVTITHLWMSRNKIASVDSVHFIPGGDAVKIPVTSQIWPDNWYMGVLEKSGTFISFKGSWKEPDRKLELVKEQAVETSQGDTKIKTNLSFQLDRKGNKLILIEKRSSRLTPIQLVFDRMISEK